jgi:hypothetical protein
MVPWNLFACKSLHALMLFNTTFNNISVILWRPVLLVEETGEPLQVRCLIYITNIIKTLFITVVWIIKAIKLSHRLFTFQFSHFLTLKIITGQTSKYPCTTTSNPIITDIVHRDNIPPVVINIFWSHQWPWETSLAVNMAYRHCFPSVYKKDYHFYFD